MKKQGKRETRCSILAHQLDAHLHLGEKEKHRQIHKRKGSRPHLMVYNKVPSSVIDPPLPELVAGWQVGRCREAGSGVVPSPVQELSFWQAWPFPPGAQASAGAEGGGWGRPDTRTHVTGLLIHQVPQRWENKNHPRPLTSGLGL